MSLAEQHDGAGVGLQSAGEQVEQRALPAAVRPDDADDLGLLDVERDTVDRMDAAEGAEQVVDRQHRHRLASSVSLSVRRGAMSSRARPSSWRTRRIRRARRAEADQPVGQKQYDRHHQRSDDDDVGGRLAVADSHLLLQQEHRGGAERRAPHVPEAADEHHHDELVGDDGVQHAVRVDERDPVGVDAAQHGRDHRAQHERPDLDHRGVDALRAGGDLVVAHRLYLETEPGPLQQQIAHGVGDRRGAEHRVEEEVVVQADRRGEPAGAAGEAEDCGEFTDRLGQRPGRDGEVRAFQPQRGPADQRRNGARDHGGDRKRRPEVPAAIGLHQDRRGVCADAEKSDMTEADVAGVTADHVPGQARFRPTTRRRWRRGRSTASSSSAADTAQRRRRPARRG